MIGFRTLNERLKPMAVLATMGLRRRYRWAGTWPASVREVSLADVAREDAGRLGFPRQQRRGTV